MINSFTEPFSAEDFRKSNNNIQKSYERNLKKRVKMKKKHKKF